MSYSVTWYYLTSCKNSHVACDKSRGGQVYVFNRTKWIQADLDGTLNGSPQNESIRETLSPHFSRAAIYINQLKVNGPFHKLGVRLGRAINKMAHTLIDNDPGLGGTFTGVVTYYALGPTELRANIGLAYSEVPLDKPKGSIQMPVVPGIPSSISGYQYGTWITTRFERPWVL